MNSKEQVVKKLVNVLREIANTGGHKEVWDALREVVGQERAYSGSYFGDTARQLEERLLSKPAACHGKTVDIDGHKYKLTEVR